MTLPNDDVLDLLESRFVLGHQNIQKELHVGLSHGYRRTQSAVGTTNGAGGRNVQFIVLAADETVLHALPGFWHAEDLIAELQLALELHALYGDERITERRRAQMFEMLHRSHVRRHGPAAERRGQWQNFDENYERKRAETEERDTFAWDEHGEKRLKSIPELVHDRLLERPFRKLDAFDMEAFVDYGRPYYDNNHGDNGVTFRSAVRANQKRQRQQEKARGG